MELPICADILQHAVHSFARKLADGWIWTPILQLRTTMHRKMVVWKCVRLRKQSWNEFSILYVVVSILVSFFVGCLERACYICHRNKMVEAFKVVFLCLRCSRWAPKLQNDERKYHAEKWEQFMGFELPHKICFQGCLGVVLPMWEAKYNNRESQPVQSHWMWTSLNQGEWNWNWSQ